MPSSPNYVRDYKQEAKYHATPSQKKKRASRNKARREAIRKGRVRLGDGLDIDHKNTNALDNSPSNLRVRSKSTNRSFKRDKNAHKA